MTELISHSVEETEKIAYDLAQKAKNGDFFALFGDLGAGKTAFVRGFAEYYGESKKVKSPTYTIVNVYKTDTVTINHFDMYRITDEDDLESCGFYEYLSHGITFCEWSENIPYALPKEYTKIEITRNENSSSERIIRISRIG